MPDLVGFDSTASDDGTTLVTLFVEGPAGAAVALWLADGSRITQSEIGADGTATLAFSLTDDELSAGARVTMAYVDGDLVGEILTLVIHRG